jgi:propionate CoA-transferase
MKNKVITADQAAELIFDNAVVSISSSSGLGCPDKVLKAIGERFDREGSPKNHIPQPYCRRRHVWHQRD